jgi:hypothetical protein
MNIIQQFSTYVRFDLYKDLPDQTPHISQGLSIYMNHERYFYHQIQRTWFQMTIHLFPETQNAMKCLKGTVSICKTWQWMGYRQSFTHFFSSMYLSTFLHSLPMLFVRVWIEFQVSEISVHLSPKTGWDDIKLQIILLIKSQVAVRQDI